MQGGLLQQPHGYVERLKIVLRAQNSVDKAKRTKENRGAKSQRNRANSSSEESSIDDD